MVSSLFFLFSLICYTSINYCYSADVGYRDSLLPSDGSILDDKVSRLIEWSSRRPVISLNGDQYRQFVKSQPRNYSMVLMLTALRPERQCIVCKQASEEFQILASSWRYSPQFSPRLFFAMVDFDEGGEVFQSLKLASAPVFLHIPSRGSPRWKSTPVPAQGRASPAGGDNNILVGPDVFDIQHQGFAAEVLAKWVGERAEIQVRVFRPPNYVGMLALGMLAVLVLAVLYIKRTSLDFLYNRTAWAIISLTFILAMISGQMWNHIRGAPLMHRNPNTGEIGFIHGNNHAQFITETYIIMLIYGAIAGGAILMLEVKNNAVDVGKRKIMVIAGLIMLTVFFSLLLRIFRSKYGGYPYSFFIQ